MKINKVLKFFGLTTFAERDEMLHRLSVAEAVAIQAAKNQPNSVVIAGDNLYFDRIDIPINGTLYMLGRNGHVRDICFYSEK